LSSLSWLSRVSLDAVRGAAGVAIGELELRAFEGRAAGLVDLRPSCR
jgi:hypothetical protein